MSYGSPHPGRTIGYGYFFAIPTGVAICDSPTQPAEGLASCSLASIVGWATALRSRRHAVPTPQECRQCQRPADEAKTATALPEIPENPFGSAMRDLRR